MKAILISAAAMLMFGAGANGAEAPAQSATNVFETLSMPTNPPANWLTYHLVHPGPGSAHPADPNCAFDWKGRYHLHYIYSNNGYNFAHVSSTDMVHWKWHPTTLTRLAVGHGMYSGTGFLTKDGRPAIIYHGEKSGHNQIAFAQDDDLETWSRPYPVEPHVRPEQDGRKITTWDPDAWLEGDTYYAIFGGTPGGKQRPATLFKSTDLKHWDYLGLFLSKDMPDVQPTEDISCPNFFKIGNKRMLLCISHNLGCRYYLGEFKNEQFVPEFHARMSWNGNTYFAPESLLTRDGRRVMWAWIMGLPTAPKGVQSLPRELELPEDGVLRIRPLRELQSLRGEAKQEEKTAIPADSPTKLEAISGNTIEIEMICEAPTAKEFGLDVLCDKNGENGLRIAVQADNGILQVGNVPAPFKLKPGEDLTLRIFIDKNLVEVFANDRQAAMAAPKFNAENVGVRLFSMGTNLVVKKITSWKMKSIYDGSDCRFVTP